VRPGSPVRNGGAVVALKIAQPAVVARDLLRAHRETYRQFWAWSDAVVDQAMLVGVIHTVFGWPIRVGRAVIPEWRGRYMAIGIAAQFELALRQKDIIGEWNGDEWSGAFTWENIPGWKLRLKTSKTRAAAVFTLTNYPLLFPLLEAVPHQERMGAIVKGEHGLPVRERSYRKWFRAIARGANIPDNVWSMDSRAGAATEADEAGADLAAISDMLTHAEPKTTVRYIRKREKRIEDAAKARVKARESADKGP
jgi:Phage integrase family